MTRQRSAASPPGFCPVRDVLGNVVDRWSLLVIQMLHVDGRTRFSALRAAIPDISPKALSATLQRLQVLGVVQRFAHAEAPPRVEYKLTPTGTGLAVALAPLLTWAAQQRDWLAGPSALDGFGAAERRSDPG